MKFLKRILSGLVCTAVCATSLAVLPNKKITANAASSQAMSFVKNMGMGWNLGNQFDSVISWNASYTPHNIETAWGNPAVNQSTVTAVKNNGFKTIRIPVTWGQMTSGGNIRTDYLARIKQVVDYAYNSGMYVIIDMHHDGNASQKSYWLNGTSSQYYFTKMWKQIGNYFSGYGQRLVFEDMNEVKFGGSDDSKYTAQGYNQLNQMNQAFVSTIRSLGGNNSNRLLVIAGADDKIDWTCSSSYKVPNDSMVAVAMHFYDPTNFTVCTEKTQNQYWRNRNTWGSGSDLSEMNLKFNKVRTYFTSKNIPVLFTEYGALYKGDQGSKDANSVYNYLKNVCEKSLQNGICACLWDSSDGGDMRYFSRKSHSWTDSRIQSIYLSHKSSGSSGGSSGGSYSGSSGSGEFKIVGQQSLGDVNGDKRIDASDATCILIDYATQMIGGKSRIDKKYGDLDGDGKVASSDATILLIYYAAWMLNKNTKITDYIK